MRILFVNDRCGFFGGVEQNIALTAAALAARGHVCALACGTDGGDGAAAFRAIFDAVHACRDLEGAAAAGAPLADIIAAFQPDVLYVHKVDRLPPAAERPAGLPVVRMVHDHDLCCPRSHKYYACSGRVCTSPAGWRCYVDGAFVARDRATRLGFSWRSIGGRMREMRRNQELDLLLVGSAFMRDELVMNGFPADRIRLLAPAVADRSTAIPIVPAARTVLFVGQLVRGKGVDLLIDAFARLGADARLIVVGKGNHEAALRQQAARLGIQARVEFRGWVDNEDLGTLFRQARVVAFPSRWPEPFGMVGLEAMRHGRPVVGFDVGGVRDWLEHEATGLLVAEQNVAGFAAALTRLLDDRALASRMGTAAIASAAQRFRFERYIVTLEALLACARLTPRVADGRRRQVA